MIRVPSAQKLHYFSIHASNHRIGFPSALCAATCPPASHTPSVIVEPQHLRQLQTAAFEVLGFTSGRSCECPPAVAISSRSKLEQQPLVPELLHSIHKWFQPNLRFFLELHVFNCHCFVHDLSWTLSSCISCMPPGLYRWSLMGLRSGGADVSLT